MGGRTVRPDFTDRREVLPRSDRRERDKETSNSNYDHVHGHRGRAAARVWSVATGRTKDDGGDERSEGLERSEGEDRRDDGEEVRRERRH